ncbi:SDR family NAD(P)-dependent oxidoreductase [Xenorhabdus bovienii]|uniref:Oxidoreductase n=1 Tax=Xenorhabdus bovienii str. kraussei Quebec TaxID=1398203 RepID=A0A077PFH1_XENBV|nr:SDR family oxidoreductase [Xenorhabdus bovienii]MDE1474530.1 SDR family oxidoreductase [Xenorhabdus bovienii]MDE1485077.1 SDR family oxidoreductase [Xenorhabdus bovienii]MDE1491686.1 SDR family oxidoreductase [Xenorhabdus bovienii]MDE1496187.1 SDR family oxidoreductase [Xenorhabdus bovienii]MDE9428599.1 SDR family oxidoreductase [Xenorhabdus bovienii]
MSTFIVTGAASGIGFAICQKLISFKYYVIAIDINRDGLDTLAEQSPEYIQPLQIDLVDEKAVINELMPLVKERELQGIIVSHGKAEDNDIDQNEIWDAVLATNLYATQRLLSHVVPDILSGGRIVIISSILGRIGTKRNTAYCASKHALLGLTKSLALDLAERQITVNAVLPAWVNTPMFVKGLEPQAQLLGCSTSALLKRTAKRIPLRRLVSPQDVANTVMFFISPDADMITAQGLTIDGGERGGM